jgi:hypothetical protein
VVEPCNLLAQRIQSHYSRFQGDEIDLHIAASEYRNQKTKELLKRESSGGS